MDLKAELSNFRTIDLDEFVREGEHIPDNVRNSVYLYNKAIEDLRTGSEDMAIIKLKKAVSMNPHFNEAMNLLGVCYLYTGDKEKAAESFNKVIRSETNSVYALSFMQRTGLYEMVQPVQGTSLPAKLQLQPGEQLKRLRRRSIEKPEKPEKPDKSAKHAKPAKQDKPLFDPNRSMRIARNIARVVAGFFLGLLVSGIIYFMLPEPEPVQLPPNEEEIKAAVDEAKKVFDRQYAELETKYRNAQKDRNDAIKLADYYKATVRLYEVESMVNARDYEGAADMLMLMKTIEYRDAEKEKFDTLYEKAMPLAAKSAYDRGYKEYNSRKYRTRSRVLKKYVYTTPATIKWMQRCIISGAVTSCSRIPAMR